MGPVQLQVRCMQAHSLPSYAYGCWHSRAAARSLVRVQAKKVATQERRPEDVRDDADPKLLLTPYEPLDSEGNPWWTPPERDFWEGPGWEWLGKGASFLVPTLLALSIAAGIYAAANYARGPAPAEEVAPEAASKESASSSSNLDFMLGTDDVPPAPF